MNIRITLLRPLITNVKCDLRVQQTKVRHRSKKPRTEVARNGKKSERNGKFLNGTEKNLENGKMERKISRISSNDNGTERRSVFYFLTERNDTTVKLKCEPILWSTLWTKEWMMNFIELKFNKVSVHVWLKGWAKPYRTVSEQSGTANGVTRHFRTAWISVPLQFSVNGTAVSLYNRRQLLRLRNGVSLTFALRVKKPGWMNWNSTSLHNAVVYYRRQI